ncbi:MAG: hypothetical protein ABI895_05765, partial [Deltaproteobacteria bacterium]
CLGRPCLGRPCLGRPCLGRPCLGLACLWLLSACGAADAARADGSASLEAVLSIERLEEAGRTDTPSASAMAQFVILPSDADVHDTLGAAGLHSQLPERSGCVDLAAAEAALARRAPGAQGNGAALRYTLREPLELLEAGEVSIRAGEMLTRLALNSFPPSGSASGVIYTTPDQSAAPLPPDENYAIAATGSSTIPPLSIAGRAPGSLSDITIGGLPLERVQQIAAGQPLDITWAGGVAGDRVYVELADNEHSLACAFPDEDGSGTVPGVLTAQLRPDPYLGPDNGSNTGSNTGSSTGSGAIRLSVHRVREAVQPEAVLPGEGLSLETTVRFDFETTAVLRVQ